MSSITRINFKTFIIRDTIVITMVGGRMAGLSITTSMTSITTNIEINCSTDWFGPDILVLSMLSGDEPHLDQGLNCVRCQGFLVSGTGLHQGRGKQWILGRGINDCVLAGVAING